MLHITFGMLFYMVKWNMVWAKIYWRLIFYIIAACSMWHYFTMLQAVVHGVMQHEPSYNCCGSKSTGIWVRTQHISHLGCCCCRGRSVNWDKRETYNISILCIITRHHGDVLTLRNEYLLPRWRAVLLRVMKPVLWFITSSWPACVLSYSLCRDSC